MAPSLINADQLKAWAKIRQDAALIRWLEKSGIGYKLDAKGKPVTTIATIDRALMRAHVTTDDVEFL